MPEKSLPEIPRPLREQFERGMAAYHKENLDYAIELFTLTLQKEPAFYECREALRAAQFRRSGSRSGFFKRLLGQASPSLAKAQIALRTKPADALHHAEQVLNSDPRHAAAHELLARAAMAAGLPRTAVLSLEIVFKNDPSDRSVALRLAAALVAAGQIPRADRIYADLLAANPADLEVARAYKDLGANRTLSDKGYAAIAAGDGTYRDALRNPGEAAALEQESRQAQPGDASAALLAEYEARLEREPSNLKLLRSIAELAAQRGDLDRSLETYRRLAATEGRSDPSLDKAIAQVQLLLFDRRLAAVDSAAPDAEDQRAAIQRERDDFELADCRERVARYPSDLALRYELGELHFRAGRLTEAIQELQKAQAHPNRRTAALALLAKCFARRGMYDIASRSLQTAIKERPAFDEEKMDLVYELGCVLEKMGRPAEAVEQFKLIYEVDIGFRDVAARVDAYYASQSEG